MSKVRAGFHGRLIGGNQVQNWRYGEDLCFEGRFGQWLMQSLPPMMGLMFIFTFGLEIGVSH